MQNTDTIQNIESKKITYIIKDKKFTGNYIFDAVQILLKGDNRVCNRSKGKINGTINTGFWEKTVGVKYTTSDRDGWGHNKHSQSYNEGLTNGKSYSKIDLDVDEMVFISNSLEDFFVKEKGLDVFNNI